MAKNHSKSKGSRLILLLVQLVIVLLCAGYLEYAYYTDIHPERQVKKVFSKASCSIINKRLSQRSHKRPKYRADFLISYTIKGVQYNRWVSGNGLEKNFTPDKVRQEKLLAKYEIGSTYACWYNPTLPQVAVLAVKHHWKYKVLPLIIPVVIGLIALFFFFKHLLQLPAAQKIKTTVRRKKKK